MDLSTKFDNGDKMLKIFVNTWEFMKETTEDNCDEDILDTSDGREYLWMVDYVTSAMGLRNPLEDEGDESDARYKMRQKRQKQDREEEERNSKIIKNFLEVPNHFAKGTPEKSDDVE